MHKCSAPATAFILQRGVHRRANTLSRHKYLAGEQVRSLNPREGNVNQLVAYGVCVCTYIAKIDGFRRPNFRAVSRRRGTDATGQRRRRGRQAGVNLSHFQITHWRYSHLHGPDDGSLICFMLPRARYGRAGFITSTRRCQLRRANYIYRPPRCDERLRKQRKFDATRRSTADEENCRVASNLSTRNLGSHLFSKENLRLVHQI